MQYQLSSAAERAVGHAAVCTNPADYAELAAPALLLGLLDESECRAALMLAKHGITTESVHRQWPKLHFLHPNGGVANNPLAINTPELEKLCQNVAQTVAEYMNPAVLETEHLLLGLLLADNEAAQWLNQRGVRSEDIQADIQKRQGYRQGSLPMEPEQIAESVEELQIDNCKLQIENCGKSEQRTSGRGPFSREPEASASGVQGSGVMGQGTGDWGRGSEDRRRGPQDYLFPGSAREHPANDGTYNQTPCKPSKKQIFQAEPGNQEEIHPSSFIHHPSSLTPGPWPLAPFRIIDAAANRAREGLRVVEDFVRFALDDRHLTEQCKQLRHDLGALLMQIPAEKLLAARETQADVGTALSVPSEEHRDDPSGVLSANFARVQESLRSLEEFGKLVGPAWAAEIKQLRYRTYTLHRAVEITHLSMKRLADVRLYVLIDGRSSLDDFRRIARELIDAGAQVLQLRDKKLDDRQLLQRGRILYELTRSTHTLFIVNDRPDLAAICRANGVHLGQEDVSVKDARAILGPEALIGVSTHTIEQARQAVLDGADYIGVGPTFPSGTKQFETFPGLDFLRSVAAEIRLPAFAIGGITPLNISQTLSTGIGRVAIGGAVVNSPDPPLAVRELLREISASVQP